MSETIPRIGDEVYVHGYIDEIRKDIIIIRNEGGYFGTVFNEVIVDRNSSEKPNNSLDKDTNVRSKEPLKMRDATAEERQGVRDYIDSISEVYVKDEPQTEDPPMDEHYKDHDELYDCDRYVVTNDEGERAYNCIGCEQTDCTWKKGADDE